VAALVRDVHASVRLLLGTGETTPWARYLLVPSPGYVETSETGPQRMAEIVGFELDSVELRRVGQRVPPRAVDHREAVAQRLHESGIAFALTPGQGLFQVSTRDWTSSQPAP